MSRRLTRWIVALLGALTPTTVWAGPFPVPNLYTLVLEQDRTNVTNGASLPATCQVGDVYVKTGTSAGFYTCLATNTWTPSGGATPAGSTGNLQTNGGSGALAAYAGTSASANQVMTGIDASGAAASSSVTNAMLAGSIAASKLIGTDIATVGTITSGVWNGTAVGVTKGGTGLTSGTSGGVPTFTGSGTMTSSGALTANMPVIGGGAGAVVGVGTVSGNTTKFATMSGSITSGNCVKVDASGNLVDFGGACGGTGSPGGSDTQVQFNDASSFGGSSGFTYNKTTHVGTITGTFISAGLNPGYVTKTTTYTAAATDSTIECLTNAFTVNLPTAASIGGRIYTLKNKQTANACTIDPAGSETIDGAATYSLVNGAIQVQSDGTNWRIINDASVTFTDPNVANAIAIWDNSGKTLAFSAVGFTFPSTGMQLVGQSSTDTLTNKTLDCVAGTGNHCTFSFYPLWTAGVCQNTTASIAVSTFTSNQPTAACKTGSNTTFGVAQYTATSQQMQGMFQLPNDWVASQTMTYELAYMGETTSSGNVTWTLSTACVAAGSTLDPGWTDTTITDAAGTSNQLNVASGNLTMPTCAARSIMFWKLTYTTAPTTPGNQDVITLSLGMTRKPQ